MEAPVITMSASIPTSKNNNNNAESRMDTSTNHKSTTTTTNNKLEIPDSQETLESQETNASTPPTSDGFSSQDSIAQETLATSTMPAGQKRTASGMIKSSLVNKSPTSPVVGGTHSRNISNTSSNRIGELSAELRARLSYAMVKVNNGWQSLPISAVESLASQVGSPTSSTTSTIPGRSSRILTSPRTTIASFQGIENAENRFTSSAPVLGASNTLASLTTDHPTTSRTYESFWREHSANTNVVQVPSRPSPFQPHPSLAPPVDIISHTSKHQPTNQNLQQHNPRRTPHPSTIRPPTLPIHTLSDLSQSTTSPHTPTRDLVLESILRTPSQKSIQEQDAIESLLWMSSPGRGGGQLKHTFPPPQIQGNQQSPLRSEFVVSVGSAKISNSRDDCENHGHERNKNKHNSSNNRANRKVGFMHEEDGSEGVGYSVSRGVGRGGDEVDRMLDGMREEVSSDEDEIELVATSRRRRVVV